MAINWDELEKKAARKDAAALKKNPKGYVGDVSASVQSEKAKEKNRKELSKAAESVRSSTKRKHTDRVTQRAAHDIKKGTVKKTDSGFSSTKRTSGYSKPLPKSAAKVLPKSNDVQTRQKLNAKKRPTKSLTLEDVKKLFLGSSYVDSNGKTARDNYDANPYTQEKQDKFWQGLSTEKGLSGTFGRAYTGVGKGFVDATTSIPSFIASKVTGKDIDLKKSMGLELPKSADTLQNTTAFKVGEVGGNLLGYGAQNIAAAPAIDAILAKTKLGQMAANAGTKLANTGVGRLAGEEAAKRFTTGLARNAVEAGTVGLAQNVGMASQEGLTGTDAVKDVLMNTGIDLVGGSVLEALPFSWAQVKGAKRTASDWLNERNAKKALETASPHVDEVIDTAKKVDVNQSVKATEAGNATTTIPKKSKKNLRKTENPKSKAEKAIAEAESLKVDAEAEYSRAYEETRQKIEDYIRQYKGKGSQTHLILKNEDATGSAVRQTVSNNDPWYSKALKQYGNNAGVNRHAKELSERLLDDDLFRAKGQQEMIDGDTWDYLRGVRDIADQQDEIINRTARDILPKPNRKLKANGVPEVHEKVGNFDVESSNVGFVSPEMKFVEDTVENAQGLFDRLYSKVVSGQRELERLSNKSGRTAVDDYTQAVRNSKGTVSYIFNRGLVDSAGNVVNAKSYKKLIEGIPKSVRKDFNTYAQHLHNIDRIREGKPVFKQFTADESQQIVDDMLKQHPEFAEYTKNINEWWNEFIKTWLVDTGRISQESFDAMKKMYPNYIPTYRVGKSMGGGADLPNRFNAGSGIRKAKGGTSDVIPLEDNFLAQINRIVSSTKKNDLYSSIIRELEASPEELKPFGVSISNKDVLKDTSLDDLLTGLEKQRLQQVKDGRYMITAYRNGQPVSAYVNENIADALKLLDDAYGGKFMRSFAEAGKTITNPVKAGITGYNPLFAISNAIRDFPTLYIQSQHGVIKTTSGIGKALKQMVTKGDLYQKYMALGGKQSGYFATGKGFEESLKGKTGIPKVKETIENILSFFGEGTETIPRLAEFINSVEKYGDTKEGVLRALKDAGEVTVNFSRSAPITKALDGWTLYLNAAVQGLDKFGRTVKSAPLKTLGRSAALITVPYAALMVYNWDNPHYQDLNDRTKQNYFLIPNWMGEKDSQGNAMTFIKLPLNREYGALLGSSLDVLYGYMNGEENPFNGYGETVSNNFAPPNPLTDNILAPLIINLPQNEDFAGRAIVPQNMEKASPINQTDASTSGAANKLAALMNGIDEKTMLPVPDTLKSPKKLDYLIDSYGGYFGQVAQAATSQAQDALEVGRNVGIEPVTQRFTADSRFSSGVLSDFYDEKDRLDGLKQDATLTGKENPEVNAQSKIYNSISKSISDLTKEEKAIKANKSLSKETKDRKIKAIRAKKNELARSAKKKAEAAAKEARTSPTFSALENKTKERYKAGKGITKEGWAKAYNAQKDIKNHSAKVIAMINNGVTTYEQVSSINKEISETGFNEGVALYNAGVTAEQVEKAKASANADDKSYISKEEAINYLNSTNYSRQQKAAIFDSLMSNPKTKNPYR